MKKLNETNETNNLRKELSKRGFKSWKISQRFQSGFPDVIAIFDGLTFYIEMKVNKNTTTALQRKTLADIAERKGLPLCITAFKGEDGKREIKLERVMGEAEGSFYDFKDYESLVDFLIDNRFSL